MRRGYGMYGKNKILAVVPARGGSKGIPHKNIVKINGKELLEYTLDAASASKYIDEIVVSTEDAIIGQVAERNNVTVLKRPKELAQDMSRTIDVLLHVVENMGSSFDYLILLQPTQPLRTSIHIDEAIEQMIDNGYPSLLSISPVRNHPILIRRMGADRKLTPVLPVGSSVRRQDFPPFYVVNGAIYINKISDLNIDTSLNDNLYGYEMPSEYDLDIDEPEDLVIFEAVLNSRTNGIRMEKDTLQSKIKDMQEE